MSTSPINASAQSIPEPHSPVPGRGMPWNALFWFGLLLTLNYAGVLAYLAENWIQDEDMGHGLFVPVLAGYIAWQSREKYMQLEADRNWWGLALVIGGALQLYAATLGTELFLARTAFIVSLAGILLCLCGWQVTRALAFPLALLFFMVPLPAIIYNQITFPLQIFASQAADSALTLLGIPVFREGNILQLPSQRLSVVEACSGIRSLLSLSFLALIYGHFFEGRRWMKILLFIATVPIAVTANALRVALTGLLGEINPELAKGFFHSAEGWVIFMVALTMLVATHRAAHKIASLGASRGRPQRETE